MGDLWGGSLARVATEGGVPIGRGATDAAKERAAGRVALPTGAGVAEQVALTTTAVGLCTVGAVATVARTVGAGAPASAAICVNDDSGGAGAAAFKDVAYIGLANAR